MFRALQTIFRLLARTADLQSACTRYHTRLATYRARCAPNTYTRHHRVVRRARQRAAPLAHDGLCALLLLRGIGELLLRGRVYYETV